MSSSALHRCPSCGHETDVSGSLEEFSKDPYCRKCGLSDSESSLKMQDELASLFMRQMSMEGVHPTAMAAPPNPLTPNRTEAVAPIVYSITQHYHHSSHLANSISLSAQHLDVPKPEIPLGVSAERILMHHNIDPSSLFPSQLELFKQAGPDQQSRLIMLWQISPPGHGKQLAEVAGNRYDQINGGLESNESSMVEASVERMEEDWEGDSENQQAEPYVISGYESLAQRDYDMSAVQNASRMSSEKQVSFPSTPSVEPSTGSQYRLANDPAYESREWWNHSSPQYPVEYQYGAFQQMNGYLNCESPGAGGR